MALKQRKNRGQKNLKARFEQMSSEELEQRWRDMRPRYFKWLGLFVSLVAIIWLVNHGLLMQHTKADLEANYNTIIHILNAAFQIASIFCCLFVCLIGMSYIYGGRKKAPLPLT
ncbi:MAG TPA: hypothetical protein VHM90_00810 [Phycisphaerae bacterium]|jgi:hypothetical protein|nr:hypothetical protein [Phycisphaerae bacterium]